MSNIIVLYCYWILCPYELINNEILINCTRCIIHTVPSISIIIYSDEILDFGKKDIIVTFFVVLNVILILNNISSASMLQCNKNKFCYSGCGFHLCLYFRMGGGPV